MAFLIRAVDFLVLTRWVTFDRILDISAMTSGES